MLTPTESLTYDVSADTAPNQGLDQVLSYPIAYGVEGVLLLIVIALAWRRMAKNVRLRRSAAARGPEGVLNEGDCVVEGRVELVEEAGYAVRVEIDQRGEESESSGAWTHSWTEIDRRVKIAPFFLRHHSGTRVRVEPKPDVYLVDEMDGLIMINIATRTRVAELTPNEQVWAVGRLRRVLEPAAGSGSYRDATVSAFQLDPPADGPMLLSSEPLDARYAKRARFHGSWALGFTALFVALHVLAIPFHSSVLIGRAASATVTRASLREWRDSADDPHQELDVDADVAMGGATRPVTSTFSGSLVSVVVPGRRIPARVVGDTATLGASPRLPSWHLAAALFLAAIYIVYRVRTVSTLPWYRKKVVENGRGRLAGR